jgi:anti-sigma factor RsiW
MTCEEVLDLVEPIAAGDVAVTDEVRAHLETCPACAAALATARRIEAALAGRPAPEAPARFTASVMSRIRSDRWQAEQQVDRIFNVAIVAALLLIVGGVLTLANLGAVLDGASRAGGALTIALQQLVRLAAPALGTYFAAFGLLGSAVVMWWWAEQRLSL